MVLQLGKHLVCGLWIRGLSSSHGLCVPMQRTIGAELVMDLTTVALRTKLKVVWIVSSGSHNPPIVIHTHLQPTRNSSEQMRTAGIQEESGSAPGVIPHRVEDGNIVIYLNVVS